MKSKYDLFIAMLDGQCDEIYESKKDIAKKAIRQGKSIYIWPAGKMGRLFYDRFNESGYCNVQLVDLNAADAILPENIDVSQNGVVIIATLNHSNYVYNTARSIGVTNILAYYETVDLLKKGLQTFPDDFYIQTFLELKLHLLENRKRYIDMYHSLEDELSKKRFLENMLFRLTGDISYTFPWDKDMAQYFNSLVPRFDENSVIIDGGGFIGDSLAQFLKYSNGDFKSYYLFEPDQRQFKLAKLVSDDKRICYIEKGLSDKAGEAKFSPSGPGGMIDETGEMSVFLTAIDEEVAEKITFIKMDIEGAELDALKGAEKSIRLYKPSLAICIYHKASDYTDIFDYIRSLNSEYKFFIRHHLDYYAETVLYAVNKS